MRRGFKNWWKYSDCTSSYSGPQEMGGLVIYNDTSLKGLGCLSKMGKLLHTWLLKKLWAELLDTRLRACTGCFNFFTYSVGSPSGKGEVVCPLVGSKSLPWSVLVIKRKSPGKKYHSMLISGIIFWWDDGKYCA